MPTLEERVAYLEGQVSEHTQTLIDIRDSIRQLERRCDGRFDTVDSSHGGARRQDRPPHRRAEGESQRARRQMSRQFSWLVGIQVTTLVAIVGALLARR